MDLVVERPGLPLVLIEIKSSQSVIDKDLRHLVSLKPDFPGAELYCFSQEKLGRVVNGVQVVNWKEGIQMVLWPKIVEVSQPFSV